MMPVAFLEDWERRIADTYQGYGIDHYVLPQYRSYREHLPNLWEALTESGFSRADTLEILSENTVIHEAIGAIGYLIAEGYTGLVRDWGLPGEDRRVAILEWLADRDRNGVYRDEDIRVEFGEDAEVNTWPEAVIYLIAIAVDNVGYGGPVCIQPGRHEMHRCECKMCSDEFVALCESSHWYGPPR